MNQEPFLQKFYYQYTRAFHELKQTFEERFTYTFSLSVILFMGGGKMKEKPKYSVYQNLKYIIGSAWSRDYKVIVIIIALILLTVTTSTLGIFLPKVVVQQITQGRDIKVLIGTIVGLTTSMAILHGLKSYYEITAKCRRSHLRLCLLNDTLLKLISTDYANIESQDFKDYKQKIKDMTSNNSATTQAIYDCLTKLGINLLGFAVYLFLLIKISPVILTITFLTTLIGYYAKKWANRWSYDHDAQEARYGKRLGYLQDLASQHDMAKDVRLFHMSHWIDDVYFSYAKLAYKLKKRIEWRYLIGDLADCLGTFIREGIAYGYLIWLVLFMGLKVDEFILLFAAISGFSIWIMGILNEQARLGRYSLEYCRLREYLEYPDQFKYEEGLSIDAHKEEGFSFELKNVSFKYPGAKENTLEDINLNIRSGEKLAIVGLNGAGKTTLMKLICGFYDPTEGEILLNGRNIKEFNRKEYYKIFTAVFQEFNILPITVAENIAQKRRGDIDEQRLEQCLTLANIKGKVDSLPEKEESLMIKSVHEEAVEFSGGETQKLMLARALYKNSPVLVLDEPTAALDPIAESELYNRYNELSAGKTAFYISHRLASTRFCDRILLMESKGIVESGTHQELLAKGGKYADLFGIQSQFYLKEKEAS